MRAQGNYNFMLDDILVAAADMIISNLLLMTSIPFTTLCSGLLLFTTKFAGKDVPFELEILRENLLGIRNHRSSKSSKITLPLHFLHFLNVGQS